LPTGAQQHPLLPFIYKIGKEWSGISSEVKRKGKRWKSNQINLSSKLRSIGS
jgi:hypothetical protein